MSRNLAAWIAGACMIGALVLWLNLFIVPRCYAGTQIACGVAMFFGYRS